MMNYVGKEVVKHYAQFRPIPPLNVIENILSFLSEKRRSPFRLAVDVGSGSGQLTRLLGPHFQQVVGVDTSPSQVEEANKTNTSANILYKLGNASQIPIPDNSADVIICCQAVHWFNLDEFYKEVSRILVDTGILAITGYTFPEPMIPKYSDQLLNLIKTFFSDNEKLWHENNKVLLNRYHNIELPFKPCLRIDPIPLDINANLTFILEHLLSRSGIQNLKRENPQKASFLLEEFQKKFLGIINSHSNPDEILMTIRFNYFLMMCRKPDKILSRA